VLTLKPMWLTGACALPKVRNDYATPATLGADRWLAAYHVAALAGRGPAVLATFGTATTIDVLVWDEAAQCHAFKGGLILAGLNTALRSVSTSTAQLPDVAQTLMADHGLHLGTHHIPNSTQAALIQGAVAAQIGAVLHLMATVTALYGTAHCYVAGGASQALLSALSARIEGVQHLAHPVLSGLQRWSPV
jgi:type III pantothenate kinase